MKKKPSQRVHDLRELAAARHLVEPPRGTLHRAIALGEALVARPGLAAAAAWLVDLLFDSATEPLPAGVRSGAGSSERRLLFEARLGDEPARQVDLRLRRTPDGRVDLVGQCLPPWPGATVEAGSTRDRGRAELGEAGEFLLRGLPGRGGRLKLRLRLPGAQDLEILDVPLPDEPARQ